MLFHATLIMPDTPSQFPSADAFLAAIINSSEDAIISKSLEGIVTSWNPGAERTFGYTAAEMVGQPISKIIPPERGAEEPDILKRIGRGERVEHFETKRVRKDGRIVDVSLTISPIKDQNGKLVGASKIARDITEQKLTERRVAEERQRLWVTLSSIGDAVIVTDVRGALQYLNPVAEALTGWKQTEAKGKPLETVFNIINEQSRRRVESPAAMAMRDGVVIGLANHTVLISRDGSEMAIDDSAAPIRADDGTVHGVVLVFRDVTGMRATAEFRERLAAVVESSDDAIITKDLTGRITSWNKSAERIFGYSQEEAIGRPITMLIPPDRLDEEPKILESLRAGKRISHFETIRIAKDRRKLNISLSISPVRNAEGEVVGASKIARDITERKRFERELAESADRMKLLVDERTRELRETISDLETFSYSLSHDLRAPLRTISGFAQALIEDYGKDLQPEAREMIGKIVHGSGRLSRFVDNILSYTRLSRAEVEQKKVSLDELVQEVITDYPHVKQSGAVVIVQSPLHSVIANEGLLTQAIANLISNGVKFVPAGTKPKLRLWSERNGESVRFWIEDNGIGIPPADQPKLFTLFTRLNNARNYEGSGVGLAVVRRGIAKMGGEVGVESQPGQGSKFWIELKAA